MIGKVKVTSSGYDPDGPMPHDPTLGLSERQVQAVSAILRGPCSACPYRKDVPSGVWAAEEYDKLVEYDAPTSEQPFAAFSCHASPEHLCHGWAVCHSNRGGEFELLALRLRDYGVIPKPSVPLFKSGAAAAAHGKKDIAKPKAAASKTVQKLLRKHKRLRESK